jgi:peptide/nickel transport system permease protein
MDTTLATTASRAVGRHVYLGEPLRTIVRALARDPGAALALLALVGIVLGALLADVLAPYDPARQVLAEQGRPPAWAGGTSAHLFGTDHLGRDVLSRVIHAARASLVIGVVATLLSLVVGVAAGLVAGYFGGRWDEIVMRLAEIQLSIPYILLALAFLVAVGPSLNNLVIVLALNGWVAYARIVRSQVLSLRRREFVEAARVVGATDARILVRHLLPNTLGTIVIVATLEIPSVIILEGSLSFLGLGVQPPGLSWGLLLSEGRNYLTTLWWVTTFPGLALSVAVLSLNLVGDWLRDLLDPRLRGL